MELQTKKPRKCKGGRNKGGGAPISDIRCSIFDGTSWALKSSGLSIEEALAEPPEKVAALLFERYREAGSDIVWGAPGVCGFVIEALGGKIVFRPVGPPDVVGTCINSPDDLHELSGAVLENGRLPAVWDITRHLVSLAKPKYPVAACMSGPFTSAGLMYGAEKLLRDLRKNPDFVHKLLDYTVKFFLLCADRYKELGLDIMAMCDPMASGDMISRSDFEKFIFPALKKSFAGLKERKLTGILHICGNIKNRLELSAESGADILSVDYKIDIKSAAEICKGKITLAGNLNPVEVLQDGTPESIGAAAQTCINDAGACKFILVPGCDTPPATPLKNIQAMTQTAHSYRKAAA